MFKKLVVTSLAIGSFVVVGCASETEDPSPEPVPSIETVNLHTESCPPPGTCALASSKCSNPRLGGTYCTILNNCFANNCPFH